jgi:hypothetical protein
MTVQIKHCISSSPTVEGPSNQALQTNFENGRYESMFVVFNYCYNKRDDKVQIASFSNLQQRAVDLSLI